MLIKKSYIIIILSTFLIGFAAIGHSVAQTTGGTTTGTPSQTTTTGQGTSTTSCAVTAVGDPKGDKPVCVTPEVGVPTGDFIYYCQGDPRWSATCGIGQAGCGPSSLAMIISTLGKAQLTPDRVDTIFNDNGWRACSASSGSNIGDPIRSPFMTSQGLSASADITGANFVSEVTKATAEGALIIASSDTYPCHCGNESGATFPAAHIVVIQKVNADGTFAVRDPSNCDFNTGQEFTQFINVNPSSVAWKWAFAINKIL